jgi:hypothetical protein
LARPSDLFAIIAARAWVLLAANQDLLKVGDPFRDSGGTIRYFWHTGRGKPGAYRQAQSVAASPNTSTAHNVRFWKITGFFFFVVAGGLPKSLQVAGFCLGWRYRLGATGL